MGFSFFGRKKDGKKIPPTTLDLSDVTAEEKHDLSDDLVIDVEPVEGDSQEQKEVSTKETTKEWATKKQRVRPRKTTDRIMIAGEMFAQAIRLWEISSGEATILQESELDNMHEGTVLGFTRNDVCSGIKVPKAVAKTEFLNALETRPVIFTRKGRKFATSQAYINRFLPARSLSGPMLLLEAVGNQVEPDMVIGWYASGQDPLSICYAVDRQLRLIGPSFSTDISENGLSENARQARTSAGLDPTGKNTKWVPIDDLIKHIKKVPLYPIAGEFAGKPVIVWSSGVLAAGVGAVVLGGAFQTMETVKLHHAHSLLAQAQAKTPAYLHRIKSVYQSHMGFAVKKSSVNYVAGIKAAMGSWQPNTLVSLRMSEMGAAKKRNPILSGSSLPANSIEIQVHPYLTHLHGAGIGNQVWISPAALARHLSIKPPKGYEPGVIYTSQKGSRYEIVYRQK